jgi:hypothetical protein
MVSRPVADCAEAVTASMLLRSWRFTTSISELGQTLPIAFHLESMTRVEEEPHIGSFQSACELSQRALHSRLIEIPTLADLEPESSQRGGHIGRIVPGVSQIICILVCGIAQHERDAFLSQRDAPE